MISVCYNRRLVRWQAKCVLDSLKAVLPFQEQLRRAKRALFGFQPTPQQDRWTIEQGIDQVQSVQAALDLSSSTVLEVGSGWQPLIPLLYSLAGAKQIMMTDLRRLLHVSSLGEALENLRANADIIRDRLRVDGETFEQFLRLNPGEGLDESLQRRRMRYLAPCDVRNTALPSESVDAVVSRAVLEHIPGDIIRGIFTESARIVRPGGITCHIIDNSDHWQHTDKSISRINFLKYSDAMFRLTCINGLNYQNRLRHSEYRQMLLSAGFEIEKEERSVDREATQLLEHFPVAPRFQHFAKDDLAAVTSFFLARRRART